MTSAHHTNSDTAGQSSISKGLVENSASMELGRYRVIDLDELFKHGDEKRAFRLIDTRTITELVVDNELYYV
jgi:hypothetical protein